MRLRYSDHDVTVALQRAARAGVPMTAAAWRSSRRDPSVTAIAARFGGWVAACHAAGVPLSRSSQAAAAAWAAKRRASRGLLPVWLRQCAQGLGGAPSCRQWDSLGLQPRAQTLRRRFGGWSAVWRAAGIPYQPQAGQGPAWDACRILVSLRAAHSCSGDIPSQAAWAAAHLRPSVGVMRRAFGSWAGAWAAALGPGVVPPRPLSLPERIRRAEALELGVLNLRQAEILGSIQRGETLQRIGARLGLSRERVRQLARQAWAEVGEITPRTPAVQGNNRLRLGDGSPAPGALSPDVQPRRSTE